MTDSYTDNLTYNPGLLLSVPRQLQRNQLNLQNKLPFFGIDIWNAYEISWLNRWGKPQIAIGTFKIPANSSNIIESKSFKLYLNSFNQTRLAHPKILITLLKKDISKIVNTAVYVTLIKPDKFATLQINELKGLLLDNLNVKIDNYYFNPTLLFTHKNTPIVKETLISNLLKSNCPITGQPDWASIQICYTGKLINHKALLKYLISFRKHKEFHEQCVERIFIDIFRQCHPQKLFVYARYTRRGGLDINPWRSNFLIKIPTNYRNARQ